MATMVSLALEATYCLLPIDIALFSEKEKNYNINVLK